jgi:hypothetical protein
MKSYLKISILATFVLFGAVNSFASADMFLQIKGKGVSKVVKLDCSNGECVTTIDDLPAGNYTFTLCDASGQPLGMKAKEKANRTKSTVRFEYTIQSPRDHASGQSSGKRTSVESNTEIVSPRDAASGLPTGKRQHKPIIITKEIDKVTENFVAVADLDADGSLDIKISLSLDNWGVWDSRSNVWK